jgi:hypothetical protein
MCAVEQGYAGSLWLTGSESSKIRSCYLMAGQLLTLKDAADYTTKLPKKEFCLPE